MRVLVTGGTGFVGSHSAKALVDAGHEVRLLVRSPGRIGPALAPHGLDGADHVVGDVTDAAAVERALDGCDAVLHAANVFSLDARRAREMLELNPRSTELVLGAAHARGLDPIVHVSTTTALLPGHGVLTRDSPPGAPPTTYARSKTAADRIARELQEDGAPVVIVSPGSVFGPDDPGLSEMTGVARDVLCNRIPMLPPGTFPAVDVRDVAAVHAAVLEPGRGPRRYLAVAGHLAIADVVTVARTLTGRRLPAVPVPAAMARASGRAADLAQRVLPVRLPVSFEAVWILERASEVDASATTTELGVTFRPLAETLADTYRWLARAGRVSARRAGRLAERPVAHA